MRTADLPSFVNRQGALLGLMTSSMPTVPLEALFGYYADVMVGFDAGVSEWLNRRREAALAAQTLLGRTREATDLGSLLSAQQEWMLGACRRFAADATAFHASLIFLNHLNETLDQKARQKVTPSATVTSMNARQRPSGKGPFRIQSS